LLLVAQIAHRCGCRYGAIIAATLTPHEVDDASQAGPLLEQATVSTASFTADRAYD